MIACLRIKDLRKSLRSASRVRLLADQRSIFFLSPAKLPLRFKMRHFILDYFLFRGKLP